jgi:hypothetical protein
MDKIEQMGASFTKGAILQAGKMLFILFIALGIISVVSNFLQWGVDDSDASAWDRSGLIIKTDHLTGVQYLKSGDALCVRVDANGDPVLSR